MKKTVGRKSRRTVPLNAINRYCCRVLCPLWIPVTTMLTVRSSGPNCLYCAVLCVYCSPVLPLHNYALYIVLEIKVADDRTGPNQRDCQQSHQLVTIGYSFPLRNHKNHRYFICFANTYIVQMLHARVGRFCTFYKFWDNKIVYFGKKAW